MVKSTIFPIILAVLLIACGQQEEPAQIQSTSDVQSQKTVNVFVVPLIETPGNFRICVRTSSSNDCRDSDADGNFDSLSYSIRAGEAVTIEAEQIDTSNVCRNSVAGQVGMSERSIAITVNFPRSEDCWIDWQYR
ncbi:MAG: hypothetical protein HRU19_15380 [Pseudobacteriovorax sp.]|nr:hypothetical protein [Pseudobacteriovorax sp.]